MPTESELQTKIRILFLAANPLNTTPLRLSEEMRTIDERLRSSEHRDRFEILQHWAVRVSDIQEHLLRHKPHIIHFSGHGSVAGEIILENDLGQAKSVSTKALSNLFSILKGNIRCVVLNACFSKNQAKAIAKEIDCLIGMSAAIGDKSAITFAGSFYRALGYGESLKSAFDLGCNAVDLSGLADDAVPKLLVKRGIDASKLKLIDISPLVPPPPLGSAPPSIPNSSPDVKSVESSPPAAHESTETTSTNKSGASEAARPSGNFVQKIDLFISSPNDVAEERRIVMRVAERLNRMHHISNKYVIRPLAYERETPAAIGKKPQTIVDKYMMEAGKADLFVCILCHRMGTPVVNEETGEKFESGTEYEFISAYRANQHSGKPQILLYRGMKPVSPDVEPVQLAKVQTFFKRFEGESPDFHGLYKKYNTGEEFEEMLFQDIDKILSDPRKLIPPDKDDLISSSSDLSDSYIVKYKQDLKERLERYAANWLSRFINLSLSTFPVKMREMNRSYRTGKTTDEINLREALEKFADELLAVLGEPGAGKTTLLQHEALKSLSSVTTPPIFVELSNYQKEAGVLDLIMTELIASGMPREMAIERFERGRFLVLLDGLNEIEESLVPDLVKDILRLFRLYKEKNQFVITCRTAEWPERLNRDSKRFEILSISFEEVVKYLSASLQVAESMANEIFHSFPWGIRNIVDTPLILQMLSIVLEGLAEGKESEKFWLSNSWKISLPQNKAQLYQQFVTDIMTRDLRERKANIPLRLHNQALMHLAGWMKNETLVINHDEAEDLLGNFYEEVQSKTARYEVSIESFVRDVMYTPPMITSKGSAGKYSRITFMHQSFQEYYTALDLQRRLHNEVVNGLTLNDMDAFIGLEDKRWWETIVLLSGLEEDATNLVEHIIRHKNLYLAARCIRDSKAVSSDLVDKIIVYGLDNFKYDANFDYDMIYALNMVFHRGSDNLPKRLLQDINWWLNKYAKGEPRELNHFSASQLKTSLESEDESFLIDVVWTLGHKKVSTAIPRLLELLFSATESVREQIVIALGRMPHPDSKDSLLKIIENPNESPWMRAFALNSIGQLQDPSVIPKISEYLLDATNPYRDSAAWALRKINHPNTKQALLDALKIRGDDVNQFSGKRYAIGTTLFALGDLGDVSVVDYILNWAQDVDDPFILEDLVYALGQLGDPKSIPIVLSQLNNPDAVVRRRALAALAKLNATDSISQIRQLTNDVSPFVREAADAALLILASTPGETLG